MGCGAAKATVLGFVCFVVTNRRVLSVNRVDLGLLFCCFINCPIYSPPPLPPPPQAATRMALDFGVTSSDLWSGLFRQLCAAQQWRFLLVVLPSVSAVPAIARFNATKQVRGQSIAILLLNRWAVLDREREGYLLQYRYV